MSRRKAIRRLHIGAPLPPPERRSAPLGRRDAARVADMVTFFMFLCDLCEDWSLAEPEDVSLAAARTRWAARIRLPRSEEEFWSSAPLLEAERVGGGWASDLSRSLTGWRGALAV